MSSLNNKKDLDDNQQDYKKIKPLSKHKLKKEKRKVIFLLFTVVFWIYDKNITIFSFI